MELVLNVVWVLLAMASFSLWLHQERRCGMARCLPLVALVMLVVILFPVISVSDDLWAVQNPAEADTSMRRDQLASCPHSILPLLVALPTSPVGLMQLGSRSLLETPKARPSHYGAPALHSVESRPPPVA